VIPLADLGVLGAALVLGVTHGFEPDHAAGISALTSETDGRAHAAFVGASFAVGHALVVVAWVAVLSALGASASAAPAAIGEAGSTLAGLVLGVVAVLLGTTGVRRLRGLPVGSEAAASEEDAGWTGRVLAAARSHLHTHPHRNRTDYLRTGVIGSLFAASPPVSMLAFVSAVVPTAGAEGAVGAVAAYTAALTVTLAAVGGGVGSLVTFVRGRGTRAYAAFEIGAAVVVVWFAASMVVGM
jgi:hypothetical protein